jgi:hypothetical protein
MAQPILLKRSSVAGKVPLTANLQYGELSINYNDGALYYLTSNNTVNSFLSNGSSFTANILTASKLTVSGNVTLTGNTILSGPVRDTVGNVGTSGQVLVSTGSGVQWITKNTGALSSLSDVNLSSPRTQQVLTYNGTQWVNADSNATVASAVFASSQSDMGLVNDAILTVTEDEGFVTDVSNNIYDLGVLSFTGIISLNNIDQSIKSDYLGYSIIFGF